MNIGQWWFVESPLGVADPSMWKLRVRQLLKLALRILRLCHDEMEWSLVEVCWMHTLNLWRANSGNIVLTGWHGAQLGGGSGVKRSAT